jgi:hypothetical protein
MPDARRQQKITFGEMRSARVRSVLIYCSDYRCGHSTAINADPWSHHLRPSDIEPRFTCQRAATGGRRREARLEFVQ